MMNVVSQPSIFRIAFVPAIISPKNLHAQGAAGGLEDAQQQEKWQAVAAGLLARCQTEAPAAVPKRGKDPVAEKQKPPGEAAPKPEADRSRSGSLK